jgi:rubrerythrin
MISQNPNEVKDLDELSKDLEKIRLAIVGELDAINLYEQMAKTTTNKKIARVMMDIAGEEKVHVGELQTLLDEFDITNKEKRKEGKKEVSG